MMLLKGRVCFIWQAVAIISRETSYDASELRRTSVSVTRQKLLSAYCSLQRHQATPFVFIVLIEGPLVAEITYTLHSCIHSQL